MVPVIEDLLPAAVGVALSPVPIIATILLLLSPGATHVSGGFVLGWVCGIASATIACVGVIAYAPVKSAGAGSYTEAALKVALGSALIALAGWQWTRRSGGGGRPTLPGWLAAVDGLSFAKAALLGFALAALNPKNLALCAAAGAAVAASGLSVGGAVVAGCLFTSVAASTVALPVLGYKVWRPRARPLLDGLRAWLELHQATVASLLLLAVGVVFLGDGLVSP